MGPAHGVGAKSGSYTFSFVDYSMSWIMENQQNYLSIARLFQTHLVLEFLLFMGFVGLAFPVSGQSEAESVLEFTQENGFGHHLLYPGEWVVYKTDAERGKGELEKVTDSTAVIGGREIPLADFILIWERSRAYPLKVVLYSLLMFLALIILLPGGILTYQAFFVISQLIGAIFAGFFGLALVALGIFILFSAIRFLFFHPLKFNLRKKWRVAKGNGKRAWRRGAEN